ncbi:MAG: hypothetical protein NTZ49_00470 [Candidatus Parcubacteria bacterium]|nr:hypothetical protein [Candidatus Parcubacteria bacterium]
MEPKKDETLESVQPNVLLIPTWFYAVLVLFIVFGVLILWSRLFVIPFGITFIIIGASCFHALVYQLPAIAERDEKMLAARIKTKAKK